MSELGTGSDYKALRKYYIGFGVIIGLLIVGFILASRSKAGNKEDLVLAQKAVNVSKSVASYIVDNNVTPKNLDAVNIANKSLDVVSYERLSSTSYKICVSFLNRKTNVYQDGLFWGFDRANVYIPPSEKTVYISEIDIYEFNEHPKGRTCITAKPSFLESNYFQDRKVCKTEAMYSFSKVKFGSADLRSNIIRTDSDTVYVLDNKALLFDSYCNKISLDSLKKNDNIRLYFRQNNQYVVALILKED